MTPAEGILWKTLRARQFWNCKFRRQSPIGPYIVDFLSMKLHLVIEVDGPIHDTRIEYDLNRAIFLREQGYRILRFRNEEVLTHLPKVMLTIEQTIFPFSAKSGGRKYSSMFSP